MDIQTGVVFAPLDTPQFEAFPKIPRLSRYCVITEKIDGTNAQIYIGDNGEFAAGSRNRWITPEQDNYGFANWAYRNKDELLKLGPGRHYGEWWGVGIQRNYGLSERRFSLFNTGRWSAPDVELPRCVSLVPVLYTGIFTDAAVEEAMQSLRFGSHAAPGFAKPEGVVVYHSASRSYYKRTLDNDAEHKGKAGTIIAAVAALGAV